MNPATESDKLIRFVEQYKKIQTAARAVLPAVAKAQLSMREYERCNLEDFRLDGIDDEYLTYSVVYNDSCHCHPEDQVATIYIRWTTIEEQLAKMNVWL